MLELSFKEGELNFYTCSVLVSEGDVNNVYHWSTDIMSSYWDSTKAKKKLLASPDMLVCNTILANVSRQIPHRADGANMTTLAIPGKYP